MYPVTQVTLAYSVSVWIGGNVHSFIQACLLTVEISTSISLIRSSEAINQGDPEAWNVEQCCISPRIRARLLSTTMFRTLCPLPVTTLQSPESV
jgi:hypothetical protein